MQKLSVRALGLFIALCVATMADAQTDAELKNKASEKAGFRALESDTTLRGGFISSNLSATSFSNTWVSGGSNNISLLTNANLFYIKKRGNALFETYLESVYGLIRSGGSVINSGPDSGANNPFVKNEDRLVFTSKYGRKISGKFNYAVLFNLNTQLFPGYAADDILQKNQHISNFMAQGFGFLSIGADYKPKPFLSCYFSPLTAKYTIVREQRLADMGAFGVRPAEYDEVTGERTRKGEQLRVEVGWYANIFVKKDFKKNLNVQSRLELFNNYETFGNIDVNLQNTVNYKLAKYFSISWISQVMYDDDIDTLPNDSGHQPRIQWKNFLGIGFSMKFGDNL